MFRQCYIVLIFILLHKMRALPCVFQTMTHVFRTHVHTEHVLRVVDLSIVVVILDTLEQRAVSIVGSIHIFSTDDN